MTKGYCKKCGLWLNLHDNGLCHTDNYGHAEGRAFPTAATPEAVAREQGQLVDVQFAPQTGEYADALRRDADSAQARAENEPILGHLTGKGREAERGTIDRTGPENIDEAVAAAKANVAGMQRDAEQLIDPPKISEIDTGEAGDADLKAGLHRSDQDEVTEDDDAKARRAAAKKADTPADAAQPAGQKRAEATATAPARPAQPAQPTGQRGAATTTRDTTTRDSGKAGS
jgi:hypothetical protein